MSKEETKQNSRKIGHLIEVPLIFGLRLSIDLSQAVN